MNKSDTIAKLAGALSKAQKEMQPAQMNATNPFLKNKYADLGEVIKAARHPLAANGLSFSQVVTGDMGNIGVETILMHESGEWISSTVSLPINEEKGRSMAQNGGAIVTYLRRYSLASILGIYADEDTDGEGDHKAPVRETEKKAAPPKAEKADGAGKADGAKKADGKVISADMRLKYLQLLDKAAVLGVVETANHQVPEEYSVMVDNAKNLKKWIAEAEEKIKTEIA